MVVPHHEWPTVCLVLLLLYFHTHSLTDTNVLVNHFNYLTILLNMFINTKPGVSCSQKMYSQVKGLNLNI